MILWLLHETEAEPYVTPSVTKLLQEYFGVILYRIDVTLHRDGVILH